MNKMIRAEEFFNKNGYIIINRNTPLVIKSFSSVCKAFEGYKKVISLIMISFFKLPLYPALIFKDLNKITLSQVNNFTETSNDFFLRTDTYQGRVANQSSRSCPPSLLIEKTKLFKKIKDRFIIIMAMPEVKNLTYKNLASCRVCLIDGKEVQEWVGPGFSEYHLGQDKFPHTVKLHNRVQFNDNDNYVISYQIDDKSFKKDVRNLLMAYGAETIKLKEKFFDKSYYQELVGHYTYEGNEPTEDDLREAFSQRTRKEAISRGVNPRKIFDQLEKTGEKFLLRLGKGESSLFNFLNRNKKAWVVSEAEIKDTHSLFKQFLRQCKVAGINPQNKVLALSIKSQGIPNTVCWDVFGLI